MKNPILLTRPDQILYAAFRSALVTDFIIESKRTNKSWCAAKQDFTFATAADTATLQVIYTAIPYGRRGYEAVRPPLSRRRYLRLEALARARGMNVDSNAFFCVCKVVK